MSTRVVDRLNALAEHDFEEGADPKRRSRKLVLVVATVASSMLLLEVLLARMFTFFLGDISSFLAIPIAMFGLSLGALALHVWPKAPSPRALPVLVPLLAVTTLLSFFALFFLFNEVFNLTHSLKQNPATDAAKTVTFSLLFVPAFALAGVVLSISFRAAADAVGRLYAIDLLGSAGACFIAPVALHFVDLPVVICLLLAGLTCASVGVLSKRAGALGAVAAVLLGALTVLGANQLVFVEKPDPQILGGRYLRDGHDVRELRHRWNDISRVALMQWRDDHGHTTHRVLHDDGISNVLVRPYDPSKVRADAAPEHHHTLPFLLDHRPRTALNIFAGSGRDMTSLYEQANGEIEVTGVELNERVPWLATTEPFDDFNLRAFYALPGVDLQIAEGRAFLDRTNEKYDIIFAGSNAMVHAARSGHSRKFLDTYEACAAYLDHLSPDGAIFYVAQPSPFKPEIFARLFEERGLGPIADRIIILGDRRYNRFGGQTTIVKPSGFSAGEIDRIREHWTEGSNRVLYAPHARTSSDLEHRIRRSVDTTSFVPTDDRPYERPVNFANFELFPGKRRLGDRSYALDWVKIFTMLFFTALSVLTVIAFYAKKKGPRRMPLSLLGYFMITGISYMLTQIGLMAKLELFMGNPLYAIAIVLASFLLWNGLGSAWIGRRQARNKPVSMLVPLSATIVTLPLTLLLVELACTHLLGWPLPLKIIFALAAAFPVAFSLGMYYPLGVGAVVDKGLHELVPMTFGLATLSSVLGSTYAMVMVINVGFRALIWQAEVGYLVLGLVVVASSVLAASRSRAASPLAS